MSERRKRRRSTPAPDTERRTQVWSGALRSAPKALRWSAALLVVLGALAYSNSLSGPFVFDDQLSVVENRQIREWRLGSILVPERDSPFAGRPLVNLSFAVNFAFGGLDVRGYHLTNIAVHLVCGLLLLGILRRTLQLPGLPPGVARQSVPLAFVTALIWTVHPLNSEVVDYLTQRTESLMAMCYVLALYCAIRAAHSSSVRWWEALAVVSCGMGMACKESMATAPFMIATYDRVYLFDSVGQALRARWRLYAGLLLTYLILAALIWTGPRGESAGFSSDVRPWTYLLNQTVMITRYLHLAIWPRSLVVWYGWALPLSLGVVVPQAALIVFLLLATVIALVRQPKLGFLGAWFFVTLAPTSSLVPIASEVGAERRMYLPLVALVTLGVVGLHWVLRQLTRASPILNRVIDGRFGRWGWLLPVAVLSAGLVAGTRARTREYSSALSLARTAVDRWPTSPLHRVLGQELIAAGDRENGIAQLRAAIPGAPMARLDLGIELFNQGRLDEAIEQLQAVVDLWLSPPQTHPYWQPPLRVDVISARKVAGQAFALQRRWPQAIEQYRLALSLSPSDLDARKLLGDALSGQETFDEAIVQYRQYLLSAPDDVNTLTRLGIALVATNNLPEAIAAFRRVVELNGNNSDARRNLATALLDAGDGDGATEHAQQAVALKPSDPVLYDLLGRALVLSGQLNLAETQFDRALQLDPAFTPARDQLNQIRQRRSLSGGMRRPSRSPR